MKRSSKLFGSVWDSIQSFTTHFSRVGGLFAIFIYFLYGTWSGYHYFLARQQISTTDVNQYCVQNQMVDFCQTSSSPNQFSKFIMFVTDGWPAKYAKEVMEHYKPHSLVYHIDVPGSKFSHAIYTSYMTGQLPTNYNGDPIAGDHILRSMKRSVNYKREYKLRYVGPEWSFLAIFGKKNYPDFFDQVRIERESLDIDYQHPYPWFFEGLGWIPIQQYFDEMMKKGESMIAHSGVFDHRQHGEHRGLGPEGENFPNTDKMARVLNTDMKSMKSWIDNHPEYVLILLSDHGVDEYGMAGYTMHGESAKGNEGFILMYNPKFVGKNEINVEVVDVCPTLATHLVGVDIPANSMGITRAYLGTNSTKENILALKRNLHQLRYSAQIKGLSIDNDRLEELMKVELSGDEVKDLKLYSDMLEFAEKVKTEMFSFIYIPWWTVAILATFGSILILYILVQYSEGLEQYVLVNNYWRFIGELSTVLILYGYSFLCLMFCWWNWSIAMRGGYTWKIYMILLALKIIDSLKTPLPHHIKSTKTGQSLVFHNEMINLTVLFLSSCFPDVLSGVDGLYVVPELGILMMLFATHLYFSNFVSGQKNSPRGDRIVSPGKAAIEETVVLVAILMMSLYDWTADTDFFFLGSIHLSGLVIYLLSFVILPIYFLWNRRTKDLIIPINLLLMFLHRDSFFERMFLLALNYQYLVNILPLTELIRIRFTEIMVGQRRDMYAALHSTSIAFQAVGSYALVQCFYTFYFGQGDIFNLDVHPMAGTVGFGVYDNFPVLSAFLMTFHKYGIFSLFCVYGWLVSELKVKEEDETDVFDREFRFWYSQWLSDQLLVALLLFFTLAQVGMYLMFAVATKFHAIEMAVSFVLLVGVMGSIFMLFQIINSKTSKYIGGTNPNFTTTSSSSPDLSLNHKGVEHRV